MTKLSLVSAWHWFSRGFCFLLVWSAAIQSGAATHPNTTVVIWSPSYTKYSVIPEFSNAVAIAAGGTACLALTDDGKVTALPIGPDSIITDYLPVDLTNIVMISAGDEHGLALGADGTLTSWGAIENTNTPVGLTNFLSIDCGWGSNLGLLGDGATALWGFWFIDTNYPVGLTNVVDISAGHRHFAALRGDGTVVSWGEASRGATAVPTGLSNVTAIACGGYHTLALLREGTVVNWGGSSVITNIPAEASNVVAIAAGYYHDLALRRDGRVVTWGTDFRGTPLPFSVSEFSNVVAIAAGNNYSVALISPQALWPSPELRPAQRQPGGLQMETSTFRGRRYFLEHTSDLRSSVWDMSPGIAGAGETRKFLAPAGIHEQNFWRVRSQQ